MGKWKAHKKLTWVERFNNLVRSGSGYGTCYWCGGAWNWKKLHTLYIKDGSCGMFTCCKDCWPVMTLAERKAAVSHCYNVIWNGKETTYSLSDWLDAVEAET